MLLNLLFNLSQLLLLLLLTFLNLFPAENATEEAFAFLLLFKLFLAHVDIGSLCHNFIGPVLKVSRVDAQHDGMVHLKAPLLLQILTQRLKQLLRLLRI